MSRTTLTIGGLAAVAMVGGLFLLGNKNGEPKTTKPPDPLQQKSEAKQKGEAAQPSRSAPVPTVDVVSVRLQNLNRIIRLPAELQAYLSVDLYPKVSGILEWIGVDRGSPVKRGEIIIRLTAPELKAQRAEAEAKWRADRTTYERLKTASATPGVVAPNDLEVAEKTMDADLARVQALKDMEAYLTVRAPFDGMVIERNVHPGALVGPGGGTPMLRIQQVSRLRLVVPVPEDNAAEIANGRSVSFIVPAYPGKTFEGRISRVAHAIDAKTRTMPVELDVNNQSGELSPGMFPEVQWPVYRSQATLFIPTKAVVTTTEKTFVIRVRNNTAEWVSVRRGASVGEQVEVFGDLEPNDQVVARGTDELRSGTKVVPRLVTETSQPGKT